ncbi:C-C motif chemokine 22 isoform X1 [Castor canadensis]|uniref:C-C motif chemokine 22 isoform X1 n=1 Tax=Castor canadensis TaxID=51338 RepID=A0AC58L4I4_CASCN
MVGAHGRENFTSWHGEGKRKNRHPTSPFGDPSDLTPLSAPPLKGGVCGPYGINVEDSVCCRDYIRHTLPLTVVKRIYWTSDSCRRPGIVLQTFKDLEICANPRMPWVKRMLRKLG